MGSTKNSNVNPVINVWFYGVHSQLGNMNLWFYGIHSLLGSMNLWLYGICRQPGNLNFMFCVLCEYIKFQAASRKSYVLTLIAVALCFKAQYSLEVFFPGDALRLKFVKNWLRVKNCM